MDEVNEFLNTPIFYNYLNNMLNFHEAERIRIAEEEFERSAARVAEKAAERAAEKAAYWAAHWAAERARAFEANSEEEFDLFHELLGGPPPPPSLPALPSLSDLFYYLIPRSYAKVKTINHPLPYPPLPTIPMPTNLGRLRHSLPELPASYVFLKWLYKLYFKNGFTRALVPAIDQAFSANDLITSEDAVREGLLAARIAGNEAARKGFTYLISNEVLVLAYEDILHMLEIERKKDLEKVKNRAWSDGYKVGMAARTEAFDKAYASNESWRTCIEMSRAAALAARNAHRDKVIADHALLHAARLTNVLLAYGEARQAALNAANEVFRSGEDMTYILSHVQVARRSCYKAVKIVAWTAANMRFFEPDELIYLRNLRKVCYVPHSGDGGDAIPPVPWAKILIATNEGNEILFFAAMVAAALAIIIIL